MRQKPRIIETEMAFIKRFKRIKQILELDGLSHATTLLDKWISEDEAFSKRRVCDFCGRSKRLENYMVHDKVWRKAGMRKTQFLHLFCLELKLNRNLKLDDFTTYPVNDSIRFGYLLGRKENG